MKRTAILRRQPDSATLRVPAFKDKTCSARKGGCGAKFKPTRAMQSVCGPQCAAAVAAAARNKAADAARTEDMRQTRAALEALKTVPMLKREAQAAFNAWVRLRDARQPCISCGAPPPDLSGLHAGRDAGHYRSTGSADHMRYVEDNCHAQCVRCNQWGAGMAVDYRIRLIQRIGQARVDALESNNATAKWSRDGLRQVRDHYRAEVARLKKAEAA
jgi:hypothetical protein